MTHEIPVYRRPSAFAAYSLAVASVLVAALIRQSLHPILGERLPFALFFLAVMLTAWYGGIGPSIAALLMGGVAAIHFFVPAENLLSIRLVDIVAMVLYLLEGIAIMLISEAHHANRRRLERENQFRTQAQARMELLYKLTASLSAAKTPAEVGDVIAKHTINALQAHRTAVTLLSEGGQELTLVNSVSIADEETNRPLRIPIDEHMPLTDAVRTKQAVWITSFAELSRQYPALAASFERTGTRTVISLPLVAYEEVMGGISVSFPDDRQFDSEERTLIQSIADQCSLSMQRALLFKTEHEARQRAEAADQLKLRFFAMISRNFHTPLTSLNTLLIRAETDRAPELIQSARRETDQLLDQINQLLDLFQLEQGTLVLSRQQESFQSLLEKAEPLWREICVEHPLEMRIPEDLPTVSVDSHRMVQVLANLLNNACSYAPSGTPVKITASSQNLWLRVDVMDSGPGIPKEEREDVFKAFHRSKLAVASNGGTGIGLAVSRALVEAHGGRMWAGDNSRGGGTTISFVLPVDKHST